MSNTTTTKSTSTTPVASTDKIERIKLAKAEHAAVKAWRKAGETGDKPATPNIDAMNADHASGSDSTRKAKASKSANPRPERADGIRFMHNGKPVAHNFLARLAANLKLPVTDLRARIASAGIEAPEMSTWELQVGESWVGAVLPGDTVPENLAVVRTARKAKAETAPQPTVWQIHRTGARTYSAMRDGVELARPADSLRKAKAQVAADGGPADADVIDMRDEEQVRKDNVA